MADEKTLLQGAVDANSLRWAARHSPDGAVELTIYEQGEGHSIALSAREAAYMARTLLSYGGDNFDAVAAARRLDAVAGQVVAYCYDDLTPGELSVSHDAVGAAGGGLDRVADRERINSHLC